MPRNRLMAGLASLAFLAFAATPAVQAQVVYYPSRVVVSSYYAPPAPAVSYYAPAPVLYTPAPVVSYYAPAPVVSYYAPAPVVSYYAPAPAYYATTTYVAPRLFRPRAYVSTYYAPVYGR